MKSKFTRMLLLAVMLCLAAFVAGCDDRSADEGPGFEGSNPTDPSGPDNPDDPDGPNFCENPTQRFTIESIDPVDGATGVSIGTDIVVEFSHEPAESSIKSSLNNDLDLITLISAGGNEVPLSYTLNGDTVFFTPTTSPLNDNTLYTFTIKTNTDSISRPSAVQAADCANGANPKYVYLTDENGDPVDTKETDFTTGIVNDLVVVDTVPVDGGNAGPQVQPVITFNQDIQTPVVCNGADAAITLQNTAGTPDDTADDTTVAGSCSVDGSMVTFTPSNPLTVGDDYRLTVESGTDGVQPENSFAEPLADDVVIDFGVTNLLNPNCDAPAAGICVLDTDGTGLVNVLLDEGNGPLAPIVGNIGGKDKLVTILTDLLNNPDGSLGGIVKGLIQEGQLQEAIKTLLLNEQNGLRTILPELLTGLPGLLQDGAGGLLKALLTGTENSACQAPLGTVCLVGSGDKVGVLDMLIGDDGYLGNTGLSQSELVGILGDTLQGDGSLQDLVTNLFQEGQLVEGLKALLIGNDETAGGRPGLLNALEGVVTNLPQGVIDTLGTLLGVNTSGISTLGDLVNQLNNLPLLGDVVSGLCNTLGGLLGPLCPAPAP